MTPPIIDHSKGRSSGRRALSSTLTAAAWALYVWLWLPLITLVAWWVGVRTAHQRLYLDESGVHSFLLLSLPIIAVLCGAVLIGWAEYNRVRFAGKDRRERRPDIDQEQVRIALGASAALAKKLRDGRIVVIALDEHARPVAAVSSR